MKVASEEIGRARDPLPLQRELRRGNQVGGEGRLRRRAPTTEAVLMAAQIVEDIPEKTETTTIER